MKAFYFASNDKKLGYDDGREIVVGETHSVEGNIKCCPEPEQGEAGLHGSVKLLDALGYAKGNILYHVDITGDVDFRSDKIAGRHREYLDEFDATELLREFSRKVALDNIELIKPYTDKYDLIVEFLETGDELLRAAAAARDAAAAARDAARAVAAYAAAAVARAAAAVDAAVDAAYAAARDKYNTLLTDMVREATGWDI